ncbi:TIGR01458 family HAD-type hydrolase [Corallincola platygyrae]|uniref:Haloacid dehalogenase-like hydrolase domain-containing protein 2 n=1 Tax=Corallincola platygyrae TaxID=1193278 RepID=A0ABW4XLI6_9GAMM
MQHRVEGVLFDLDGVIYDAGGVIAGAVETITYCREQEIAHLFLTNTSSKPRSAIATRLNSLGIKVDERQILTPPIAAAAWLSQRQWKADLYVPESTLADFTAVACSPDQIPNAVVVGDLAEQWNFALLNQAFRQLQLTPEMELLALGMTRYWKAENGLQLDAGPFVKALEYASGKTATVMGKPARSFFEAGCSALGLLPAQCVMIGDDIASDVDAAQQAGLVGVLIKTGKFQPDDLRSHLKPDAVLNSVAELPDWLSETCSGT